MDLEEGSCYLLKEAKPVLAFRLLRRAASQGTPALCITRQYPNYVRKENRLGEMPCVWLSESPGEDHQSGKALASLAKRIEEFLTTQGGRGFVLIDGLEYLVISNGFEVVLLFLEHLNEFIMARRAVLVVPSHPKAFDSRQMAMLERDMHVPDVQAWLDELDRGDWTDRLFNDG